MADFLCDVVRTMKFSLINIIGSIVQHTCMVELLEKKKIDIE